MIEQVVDISGNYDLRSSLGTPVLRITPAGALTVNPAGNPANLPVTFGSSIDVNGTNSFIELGADVAGKADGAGSIVYRGWDLAINGGGPAGARKISLVADGGVNVEGAGMFVNGNVRLTNRSIDLFAGLVGYGGAARAPWLTLRTEVISGAANDWPMNEGNYTDFNHVIHRFEAFDNSPSMASQPGIGPMASQSFMFVRRDAAGVRYGGHVIAGTFEALGRNQPGAGTVKSDRFVLSGLSANTNLSPGGGATLGMTDIDSAVLGLPANGTFSVNFGGVPALEASKTGLRLVSPLTGPNTPPQFTFTLTESARDLVVGEVFDLSQAISGWTALADDRLFYQTNTAGPENLFAQGFPADGTPLALMRLAFVGAALSGTVAARTKVQMVWRPAGGSAWTVLKTNYDTARDADVDVTSAGQGAGLVLCHTSWFKMPQRASFSIGIRVQSMVDASNNNAISNSPFRVSLVTMSFA